MVETPSVGAGSPNHHSSCGQNAVHSRHARCGRDGPVSAEPAAAHRPPTSLVISTEPPWSTGAPRTCNDPTSTHSSRERRDPAGAAPASQPHPSPSERQRSHLTRPSFSHGISPLATIVRRLSDLYGTQRPDPAWKLGRDDGVGEWESVVQGPRHRSSQPWPADGTSAFQRWVQPGRFKGLSQRWRLITSASSKQRGDITEGRRAGARLAEAGPVPDCSDTLPPLRADSCSAETGRLWKRSWT